MSKEQRTVPGHYKHSINANSFFHVLIWLYQSYMAGRIFDLHCGMQDLFQFFKIAACKLLAAASEILVP